jgi:hypothetical protein
MLNDPDYDGFSDPLLGQIYKANGFDALPQVVPGAEIDRLAALGQPILYRGVRGDDAEEALSYLDQFRGGDYFPGVGTSGNGTYTSTKFDTALNYARSDSNHVMRMVLDPGARIINREDLFDEMREAHFVGGLKGSAAKLLIDQGRFAAARGYDAIRFGVGDEEYYIVLNRGKVIVDSSNGRG